MSELEKDLFKSAIRGFSRVIILWLVSHKPMSGYTISKELKRLTGWSFHSGVVYPLIYELEENKLVNGEWIQKGRRRIKYYFATKEGLELLNRVRGLFEMPVKEVLKDFMT